MKEFLLEGALNMNEISVFLALKKKLFEISLKDQYQFFLPFHK